jgi:hypothetical protein
MSTSSLDTSQVGAWLQGVRREIAELELRIGPLLEQRMRLEERERILVSLLDSLGDGQDADAQAEPRPVSSARPGSVKEYVELRVIEILEESDRDRLHINEIHARYRDKGYEVPGAGRPVNLTTHIRISDRIKSPKRGYYGLVERIGDFPVRTTMKKRKRA